MKRRFFFKSPNEMQYTIRKLYSTERKASNNPYGSNGSLSLSPPHYVKGSYFFLSLPNEMQHTIR